ncbi:DUF2188 domain-containing protein [Aciduricibacillus chroicocephali]|uniref:DUF2188 domain-containing protein n=1 Tax=Aciduricibacillus chroicocephali TaxID=3054939 RepID=A0ABY9KWI5_9BACI|nr:DUF2188 domain-containing protein [Bacillaceae bacterium 44XB]
MPWDMNDYPASMKNLEKPVKKKAINIANAMLDEGYEEGRVIPIAIEQAKEWSENHSVKEVKSYEKHGNPTKRDKEHDKYESHPERMEESEVVESHKDGWQVKSEKAKKASNVYGKKSDAIRRAEEIAENKGTELKVEDEDGNVNKKESFD